MSVPHSDDARYSLCDIFSKDPRPTLLIDLLNTDDGRGVRLELANDALTQQYGVLLRFIVKGSILEPDFLDWLRSPLLERREYVTGDLRWTQWVIEDRWKVVNVTALRNDSERGHTAAAGQHISERPEPPTRDSESSVTTTSTDSASADSQGATGFCIALPSGLVSLGSAPTALEGLHRTIDLSEVGFFEYSIDGTLIYANRSFYSQSGHGVDPESHSEYKFVELLYPDDSDMAVRAWQGLAEGKPITFEMRWKHMATPSAKALGAT